MNSRIRNAVMTQIVQALEMDKPFTEVVYNIFENAEQYLQTTNIMLLQINSDRTVIDTIIDYHAQRGHSLKRVGLSAFRLDSQAESMLILREDCCPEGYVELLQEYDVKASVTVPICINGIIAMYLGIFDTDRCIVFSEEQLQFVTDISKIIQSIAQKKVINSSLISSYEVLTEILGNIGTGIVVCSRSDGLVFFENKVAQESQEVRKTMKECIQDFFSSDRSCKNKYVEYYDCESGLWFEIKFADLKWIDGSQALICTAADITQKKKTQKKIEFQAQNDFLTGLYNRMKCESDLKSYIKAAVNEDKKGAILFIDLDDFKNINDGLGHQYGDILLQQIAAGLMGIPGLRGNCYRMGGDEFVVIVNTEIYSGIEKIVKNISVMFSKKWYLMETEYYCTMSMGIITFPDNGIDVNELIKKADIAMYQAKKAGKNRYVYYDENSDNTVKRLDIENNMRQAVASECDEFVVFYQPVVDTVSQECVSCEALVRWDSKAFGFMAPGEFIPLAEYLGLITSIGDFVLEEACCQCKRWNEGGFPDFRMNVNLSVVQLLQKSVVENIRNIIERSGVNPTNIVLEITETFAINDMNRVMGIIEGLKKLGIGFALDDFGTGYSSLSYIKQLPLDIIKVDKTFIDDIVEDDYAQAFIKLIVELSKTIGTQICVEGVEHREQYFLLRELGVDFIQGYYFGRPVNARLFEKQNLSHRIGQDIIKKSGST